MSKEIERAYQHQLDDKLTRLNAALQPYLTSTIQVFESAPVNHRMRAEFRVWHQGDDTYHIMYDKQTKAQYRVDSLPAACELINAAMPLVIENILGNNILRKKLFQIDYLASLSGELVISLIYHKALEENWVEQARILRNTLYELGKVDIIGRAKKQKHAIEKDFVNEELTILGRQYYFKQIENSFTQPNASINVKMIEWVMNFVNSAPDMAEHDLLELYCGAGNFSIPLSTVFSSVLATEISKTSVSAAQVNIKQNGINNLKIARLSSQEFVEAYTGKRLFNRLAGIQLDGYQFATVLVDPPRSGLDPETLALVSQFNNIIYISCNPKTLVENIEVLSQTHVLRSVAMFDQFPFTDHIETGVVLSKIG